MVHVDRFVAVVLKLPVDFAALKRLGFLLRYPNKDDRIPHRTLTAKFIRQVIFLLFVPELVNRNSFLFRQDLHCLAEPFRDLPQHYGRGDRLAQLLPHEEHQPWSRCQFADVPIQVQAVKTFHFQGYVSVEKFRNGCHPTDFTKPAGEALVGLRSKTSLDYSTVRVTTKSQHRRPAIAKPLRTEVSKFS